MHNVFIGLGSNLENPQKNIIDAIDIIKVIESINLISCLFIFRSDVKTLDSFLNWLFY